MSTERNQAHKARRPAGIVLAAFFLFSLFQPARASADGAPGFAAANIDRVVVRQGASQGARALTSLRKGDIVLVTDVQGDWNLVSTVEGKSGWCKSEYLTPESDGDAFRALTEANLNWPSRFVDLAKPLTYQQCVKDMQEIAAAYPRLARVETVGKSVFGNPIDALVLGNPQAKTSILVQAEAHAREWIVSPVVLRQAENLLISAESGASYNGRKVSEILENEEIWVIPMLNVDGMRLANEGLAAVPPGMAELAAKLKAMNRGSGNFRRWKANANGVDLNRNFPAGWKPDKRYKKPGIQNYEGPAPFSEPETAALRDLTVKEDFALTVSYHAAGKMIYWIDPTTKANEGNLAIAKGIRSLTHYTVIWTGGQKADGGYRDWFVQQYDRPGLTIEVGLGNCPLPWGNFNGIWKDNRYVLLYLANLTAPKSVPKLLPVSRAIRYCQ